MAARRDQWNGILITLFQPAEETERLPDASHWVHHDEAERVTQLLTDFFAPALPAKN